MAGGLCGAPPGLRGRARVKRVAVVAELVGEGEEAGAIGCAALDTEVVVDDLVHSRPLELLLASLDQ